MARRASVRFGEGDGADTNECTGTSTDTLDERAVSSPTTGPSSSNFRRMSKTFSSHRGLTRKARVSRVKVIDSHPHYEINLSVGSRFSRLTYRFMNFYDLNAKVERLWHPLSSGFPRRRFRSKLSIFGITISEDALRERRNVLSAWVAELVDSYEQMPELLQYEILDFFQIDEEVLGMNDIDWGPELDAEADVETGTSSVDGSEERQGVDKAEVKMIYDDVADIDVDMDMDVDEFHDVVCSTSPTGSRNSWLAGPYNSQDIDDPADVPVNEESRSELAGTRADEAREQADPRALVVAEEEKEVSPPSTGGEEAEAGTSVVDLPGFDRAASAPPIPPTSEPPLSSVLTRKSYSTSDAHSPGRTARSRTNSSVEYKTVAEIKRLQQSLFQTQMKLEGLGRTSRSPSVLSAGYSYDSKGDGSHNGGSTMSSLSSESTAKSRQSSIEQQIAAERERLASTGDARISAMARVDAMRTDGARTQLELEASLEAKIKEKERARAPGAQGASDNASASASPSEEQESGSGFLVGLGRALGLGATDVVASDRSVSSTSVDLRSADPPWLRRAGSIPTTRPPTSDTKPTVIDAASSGPGAGTADNAKHASHHRHRSSTVESNVSFVSATGSEIEGEGEGEGEGGQTAAREARSISNATDVATCVCGNAFMDDSAFCRKCGRRRSSLALAPIADDAGSPDANANANADAHAGAGADAGAGTADIVDSCVPGDAAEADAVAADSSAGSAETSVEVAKLLEQIAFLKAQLEAAGAAPVELVELAVAESEMKKAVQRLMEGDETAEKDLERWDRCIQIHPDYIKRKEEEARKWEEKERPLCVAALRRQRAVTPLAVTGKSVEMMVALGLTKLAATRLRQKKALWLVRMHSNNIRRMHVADLRAKFATQGLDIVEMRAVWASLPDEFDNDGDGAKEEWKKQIRTKLVEMSLKEERGSGLMRNEKRHSAYKGLEPTDDGALQLGFDLESVVEVEVAKSTAFDPVDIQDTITAADEGPASAAAVSGGAAPGGRGAMLEAIGGRTACDREAAEVAAAEGLAGAIRRKSATGGPRPGAAGGRGEGMDLMAAIAGRGRGQAGGRGGRGAAGRGDASGRGGLLAALAAKSGD